MRQPSPIHHIGNTMQAEGTEKRVCEYIAARQQFGKRKYGTTVEANPLELRQWLQHMLDELLDGAIYCQRSIEELDKKADDCK